MIHQNNMVCGLTLFEVVWPQCKMPIKHLKYHNSISENSPVWQTTLDRIYVEYFGCWLWDYCKMYWTYTKRQCWRIKCKCRLMEFKNLTIIWVFRSMLQCTGLFALCSAVSGPIAAKPPEMMGDLPELNLKTNLCPHWTVARNTGRF